MHPLRVLRRGGGPAEFIAVEEWADRAALDLTSRSRTCAVRRRLLELVSERPEVAIHEIAETKPFPGSASTNGAP